MLVVGLALGFSSALVSHSAPVGLSGWCAGLPSCSSCFADTSCAWCATTASCLGVGEGGSRLEAGVGSTTSKGSSGGGVGRGGFVCKRWAQPSCSAADLASSPPGASGSTLIAGGGLCQYCTVHKAGGCKA